MSLLKLRPLSLADAELVFSWRNEPYLVNLGTLKKTVTWEEHLNWIKNTVVSNVRKAYLIELEGVPAGQVRFDAAPESIAFISVYLLKEFSGKGVGIELIKLGCSKIFMEWQTLQTIVALVRKENVIGQKAFSKAGFMANNSFADKEHVAFTITRN